MALKEDRLDSNMALTKSTAVLVLGATGPAGICLVRELLYRQYKTVVYARNPAKIPQELSANPLLTVCCY